MRFAERLFRIMDENEDGELTIEEFVKGFHKLKVKGNVKTSLRQIIDILINKTSGKKM